MNPRLRDLVATAAWTALFLVLADVVLSVAFRPPASPTQPPSRFQLYFDFGRSIEGKLRAAVRDADSLSAPVIRAGWLEPFDAVREPAAPRAPGGRLVAVYGQSFTFMATAALPTLDTTITLRSRGGPASPVPHGYALWTQDRTRLHADVAILGILASSLRGVDAMTHATWQFEAPAPFTYPRYRLAPDGRLEAEWPRVRSLDDLRRALDDPAELRAYEAQLAAHDAWYRPELFKADPLDRSSLCRMLRRAWAQREQREHLARLHGPGGFREGSGSLAVVRALATSFVDGCRADGTQPIVLLVEDRGYGDHLSRALGPSLQALGADWIATHDFANPEDPDVFVGDGHFKERVNARLAKALLERIRAAGR